MPKPMYINLIVAVVIFIMQLYLLFTSKRAFRAWNEVFDLFNQRIKRLEKLAGIHYEEEEETKNANTARRHH